MMAEIRCDSATLHIYTGLGRKVTDPQLGERQFFKGRERVALASLGKQVVHVYAWLWRDAQPVWLTDPVWLWPGDTFELGPILTLSDV